MTISQQPRSADDTCCEVIHCTLDKIAQAAYDAANEAHRNGRLLAEINAGLTKLVELYEDSHPDQALQRSRLAQLESKVRACCPPEVPDDTVYKYVPCERGGFPGAGEGWCVKSVAQVTPERVSSEHPSWKIKPHKMNESDETLPAVERGPFVGQLVPSNQTATPMDFRSGSGPVPGGQQPVTFRTFTNGSETQGLWPPDMSGAKSGDVVLMSGNLWLKLSVDGGKTFTDLDFTKVFSKAPKDYGDWKGDQVVIYVPEIDCFVLYVQSAYGAATFRNKSVVKVAIASPADLKKFKGLKPAWTRQWHFTSDTFSINAWLDFPDISYGAGYLYINTNTFASTPATLADPTKKDPYAGKLFWEMPLSDMKAHSDFSVRFGYLTDRISYGSPAQNIGDENYWAGHVDNGKLRIYSSKGTDENYFWRDRSLRANYPVTPKDGAGLPDIVSKPPDASDWLDTDNRIIGATKVNNQLWFAWTAAPGSANADGSGFNFPQAHIQIAKVDLAQDYKVVDQTQVWNANYAFAYPSLVTNSNNEVGISCAWGGGGNYGSHVVGIIGDFVLWYGEASDRTSTVVGLRFGDYLHVRLAHPDTRFFSGFGYAVHNTASTPPGESANYLYVEFGREAIASPGLH